MNIGIKNGKVFDVCSDLINKRTADDGIYLTKKELDSIKYFQLNIEDIYTEDTWDFENKTNLKDSPKRFEEKPKTDLELKIEELEERLNILEAKKIE